MGSSAKLPTPPDFRKTVGEQLDMNKGVATDVMNTNRYAQEDVFGNRNDWITNPDGSVTNKSSFGQGQQDLYNKNNALANAMAGGAGGNLDQFQNKYWGGGGGVSAPSYGGGGGGGYGGGGGGGGSYSSTPGQTGSEGGLYAADKASGVGGVGTGIQGDLDYSKLSAMPGDTMGERQNVQDALYKRNTGYLDPQYAEQQRSLETQLSNKGLVPGTPAYNNAMQIMNQAKERAYTGARQDAISGGGAEQERLQNMILQLRNQGVTEANNLGAFHNASQGQRAGQLLTDQGQQRQLAGTLGAASASAGASMHNAELANQLGTRSQAFNELLQMGKFGQSGQEIPQFQTSQGNMKSYESPDLLGAEQKSYADAIDRANAAKAKKGGIGSALGSLAGAGIGNYLLPGIGGTLGSKLGGSLGGAFGSDRRLKSNIVHIGVTPGGHNVYEYDAAGRRQRGVMAQELLTSLPGAVSRGMSGFYMVDYSKVT